MSFILGASLIRRRHNVTTIRNRLLFPATLRPVASAKTGPRAGAPGQRRRPVRGSRPGCPRRSRRTTSTPSAVATPMKTVPTALPSCGSGPATPVVDTPMSAPQMRAGAVGHGRGHLPVHGADGVEQLRGDAQDVGLDRVLVGDDAALQHAGGAGRVGQHGGDHSGGEGFRGGDGQAAADGAGHGLPGDAVQIGVTAGMRCVLLAMVLPAGAALMPSRSLSASMTYSHAGPHGDGQGGHHDGEGHAAQPRGDGPQRKDKRKIAAVWTTVLSLPPREAGITP